MLEKVWNEISKDQKKEIGKYAVVFTGGVLAGLLINKLYENSMGDVNKRSMEFRNDVEKQIDIRNLEEDIKIDEDTVEDVIEK